MARRITLRKAAGRSDWEAMLVGLNEVQRLAAAAPDGVNLILAGPGSGKTRVITHRVAWLIGQGVAPESILLTTFTRRAAREMVARLSSLVGPAADQVWAGTFHQIANRLLRRREFAEALGYQSNFSILDAEDALDLVAQAIDELGLGTRGRSSTRRGGSESGCGEAGGPLKPSTVQAALSLALNTRTGLPRIVEERFPELSGRIEQVEAIARTYAAKKRAANAMDYDDLLVQWMRLMEQRPDARDRMAREFTHLLVDEMQDTNTLQIEIVETLAAAGAGNLTAVGDDAQSIYRFRGANYDNLLKFPERHPGCRVFRLEINYRSTPEIVAFTNDSIRHNVEGFPKTLISARPASHLKPLAAATSNAYEESDLICQLIQEAVEAGRRLGEIAVLYRNHHDSIVLQGDLVTRGLKYTVRSGLRFFEQAHIKDVLAHLRVLSNPRDETAWRRLLLLLPGIGPAAASRILETILPTANPLDTLATAEAMASAPPRARGRFAAFVADLAQIRAADPGNRPAEAVHAVLKSGYTEILKQKYEHPEQRLKDIEQLGVLAARYDALDRLVADLLLAGDVYGMDTLEPDEPAETLVLSTVHQAKGLEWSMVFVMRLIEESFPNARAVIEPGGLDEERRIFYVAITRAKDELILTYPHLLSRGGRGPVVLTKPSRFLQEIDVNLYERAIVSRDVEPF
ncbi:UvrD/REP helicase [Isosphaera pallida ATCC 43644]|uniref:DNA 3'-5' helicase n=1 Tax=Isosphaera pallida (strain ATCC 43644 / DSM 9630 / IS1B) TaxID=575540 RepID=E8R372_ISOPI|nr:ATP-dependent helicase [Isosphaera pallida]ADV62591.1 UvrD/REP helicase [Isosphaera pallida ATCC 43644]